DDASMVDDLGADFLEVAEIVMMIQDEFNIELSDDVAKTVITVGDAIYVVTSKTKS
ncbi:acyl carrier protein, partial [Sinorhizobium meliloti]